MNVIVQNKKKDLSEFFVHLDKSFGSLIVATTAGEVSKSNSTSTKKAITSTSKSKQTEIFSTDSRCGPDNGNPVYPKSRRCCSKYGYCDDTAEH
ncbi:hypothetical protein BCR32DRAFT_283488 [Anaeromyces robustus]|uniref:Chitin-binding type-1 domain-containing protein n=1 Tax=Anaeromyces robustus TaxID=1754192 RepID=A0A1Y1WUA6_9FUNG|nr:hypothetical protein BCR32DRAFT_283488 [Anaeromyces robustus]|eukprot:ORX77129.1 hypothetical protein BCR32DRAFT_283488 [Anaeromyces robustus]